MIVFPQGSSKVSQGNMLQLRDIHLGMAEAKFQVWSSAQGGHSSKSIEQGDSRLAEEEAGDSLSSWKATKGRDVPLNSLT